jgi:hypothetical protein|tara:strand:- start:1600 stop:1935 length:336 start_codon:yes stop_codon:yes gene_type:complete
MEIEKEQTTDIIKFTLTNKFCWDKYEQEVKNKIINAKAPVEVIWDLREMNKIPSPIIIGKQILLLKTNKTKMRKNIIKNSVLVNNKELKGKIEWIFRNVYKPENPTEIICN